MDSPITLKDKIVILTGAAGFFGRTFAREILRADVKKVYLLDVNEEGLEKLAADLRKQSFSTDKNRNIYNRPK